MTSLTAQAKETLRNYGVTQAAWLRAFPQCDRCGCSDDRCIGYHHTDELDCGCLTVLLTEPYYRDPANGYLSPEVLSLLSR